MKSSQTTFVHSENEFASGVRKRPRGPRPRSSSTQTYIPEQPLVDLKSQAIAYYLHNHVQPLHDAPSIAKSVEDDIEWTFNSRRDSPTIQLAISVIALVLYGKAQNQPQAVVDACVAYQKLLHDIQFLLSSPAECDVEVCLFSTFCMGRYEDTVHASDQPITRAWAMRSASHHDGALAVLKAFKDRQSSSNPPIPDIVKHTRRGMIKSALMRNRSLPEWIWIGRDFGEEGLESEYDSMIVRLVDIRQRLFSLRSDVEGDRSSERTLVISELVKGCQDLELDISRFPSRFPNNWIRQKHLLPVESGVRDSPQIVYSYQNLSYASVWSRYYATRLLVNSTLIGSLKLLHSVPNSPAVQTITSPQHRQLQKGQSTIAEMASEFQSSLPFCLGNITGVITEEEIHPICVRWLAWPLTMVMFADELDRVKKEVFMAVIMRLGRRVGIGALMGVEDVVRQNEIASGR